MTRIEALRTVLRAPILSRSVWTAVVVGSVLNAINQGDALLAGAPIEWFKLTLTYIVPFLVVSYGGWSALLSNSR